MDADPILAAAPADPASDPGEPPSSAEVAGGSPAEASAARLADAPIKADSPEGYVPV